MQCLWQNIVTCVILYYYVVMEFAKSLIQRMRMHMRGVYFVATAIASSRAKLRIYFRTS